MSKLDKEIMINSYNNISFYGERRGLEDFNYYSEMLSSDLENLGKENQGNYKDKFINKVMDIYYKQARCTSAFIVGPANYNIRRHNKSRVSRDNAYEHFERWREKYFKSVNRVRTLSPEDEIEKSIERIDKLLNFQAKMKETNKLIRRYKDKDDEFLKSELLEIYENDHGQVTAILEPNCFGNIGYASYELTSVSTKIRNERKKIEVMKVRIERKDTFKPIEFKGVSVYIENDRVIIKHDEKPSREVIEAIKKRGFKWSPKMKNWCRKHTGNAIYDVQFLISDIFLAV